MSRPSKARKNAETTNRDSKHTDEPSNCIICLEKVICRGKLSVCNHWFCFPCILEWSENTNTCPICKARFRCITKVVIDDLTLVTNVSKKRFKICNRCGPMQVHLSPFRSPPTKVRVGDKDQRVWNDDDELVEEDVFGAFDLDDFDDDYEPSSHYSNPWTRQSRQQMNTNLESSGGSHICASSQLHLNEYDLEDSFINDDNDDDEPLFTAYHSTDSEESNGISPFIERTSPYQFRNRHDPRTRSSRNTSNINNSFPKIEDACSSQASLGSFIVSSDDSPDELNSDWVPFGNIGNNSRTKGKSDKVKAKECCSKRTRALRKSRSKTPKKHKGCKQKSSNGKRKRQQSTTRNERTSLSHGEPGQCSMDGWISMASKNGELLPLSSLSTNLRTPKKRTYKGKKATKNEDNSNYGEVYDRSSASEDELLIDRINKGKKIKTSVHSWQERKPKIKPKINKLYSRWAQQQESIPSALMPVSSVTHDDRGKINSVDEEDYSDVIFVHPTPQPNEKRSIFTRRKHRSPGTSFDNMDVITNNPPHSQIQTQYGHKITDSQSDTCRTRGRTEAKSRQKSPIKATISPAIKKRKKPRRVLLLSSDSD